MKDKKLFILILLILMVVGYIQSILYSPLTPKAAAIAHFKIDPKLIPKPKPGAASPLTETEIKEKHGRLELIRLNDSTNIRGVVIEQGEGYIRVETPAGIRKFSTDQIDTVEILR